MAWYFEFLICVPPKENQVGTNPQQNTAAVSEALETHNCFTIYCIILPNLVADRIHFFTTIYTIRSFNHFVQDPHNIAFFPSWNITNLTQPRYLIKTTIVNCKNLTCVAQNCHNQPAHNTKICLFTVMDLIGGK